MKDSWEIINGTAAHSIEYANYRAVVEFVESLVINQIYNYGGEGNDCPMPIGVKELKLLHRMATQFLLENPGEFRQSHVQVMLPNGDIILDPPLWRDVPEYIQAFENDLSRIWHGSKLNCAAFALWRINWIHPFLNGNGRTARAFAYAVLCLRYGGMIKRTPSIIERIDRTRDRYYRGLTYATNTHTSDGLADLRPLADYLDAVISD